MLPFSQEHCTEAMLAHSAWHAGALSGQPGAAAEPGQGSSQVQAQTVSLQAGKAIPARSIRVGSSSLPV